jgi:hypothetical protein
MSEVKLFESNEIVSFESAIESGLIFSVVESYEESELKQQCFMSNRARALCLSADAVEGAVQAGIGEISLMLKRGATAEDVTDGIDLFLNEHFIRINEAMHVSAVIDEDEQIVKMFIGLDDEIGLVSGLAGTFL